MKPVYIVLEFSHPDHLLPAVAKLESFAAVAGWDAVLGQAGHADLVLRLNTADGQPPAELLQLEGLKRTNLLETAEGESFPANPTLLPVRAYVFMDTVPEQKESVREAILALPGAVFCTRMATKCDLVALVQDDSLAQLKETIHNGIQALDGVLRLKAHYVFSLNEL